MGLVVKENGSDFEITPEGTYVARCIKMIDMGTQTTTGQYGTKSQRKIMIQWELLDDDIKMADGKPFAATQFYTASLHEKAQLRKDLEAWRGKKFSNEELEGFDLQDILGAYCMLQVVHSKDGNYANVNSIMSYKGSKPKGVNDLVAFDMDNPDMEIFKSFSDKMKEKLMATPEWQERDRVVSTISGTDAEDGDSEPVNLNDVPV